MYDLIVIGGGPGGYMAADRAGHAGLSVLLIEERALGGVCLNEGCIPSKTLLHSAKVYDYALHGQAYGVSVQGAALDHKQVIARKGKVVETLTNGVGRLMKARKVTVVYGKAYIVDNTSVRVNDETYSGKRLIIATGSAPVIPPIEGVLKAIENNMLLTSREILDLEEVPKNLAVIGGGAIGLEMAAYYNAAGSKVTVIEMLPKIGGAIDDAISAMLLKNLQKKGIEFKLGSRVVEVQSDARSIEGSRRGGAVIFEMAVQGPHFKKIAPTASTAPEMTNGDIIPADKVLLSIGRKPNIDGFGLENTGVATDRGAILTDANGLTNVPNIYAIGDVNGRYMLAHVAYREAEVAVNHMLGKHDVMRYDAVPSVIYTAPEVASVGETEESGRAKGIDCISAAVPMNISGRFVAENADADGICKVMINREYRNIVGVHILGSYASEMIAAACTMIEMQMTVEDAKEIVFPHPTVSEVIREAVFKL